MELDRTGNGRYCGRVDEAEAERQAWGRMLREAKLRSLRFGAQPGREQKLAERWHDPRKRKLEPHWFNTLALTSPARLEEYLAMFASIFGRRDTLRQAKLYVLGLLSPLSRKNGETMEAGIPGVTQEGVYHFLVHSPWSAAELDRVRVSDALERTGCKGLPVDAIIDECGWRKKGRLSVGVARQYLGSLGKVDNGQVIVSLHLTCGAIDVPGPAEVYMPQKQWGGDDDTARRRREKAGVPADWRARTKPELAAALVERVRGWGLQVLRVHGDSAYGEIDSIRVFMDHGLDVAMGIRANDSLRLDQEPWLPAEPAPPYAGRGRPALGKASRPRMHTPEELRHGLLDGNWKPVAYRQDVNGRPLTAEFVAVRGHLLRQGKLRPSEAWPADAETGPLWIVLERPCGTGGAQPENLKQYALSGPPTMRLDELAQIAHHRPVIERTYENAKQEVGLDDYQGRSWAGLHHHLALVWLALTWLMLLRRELPPTPPAFSQPTDAPAPESPSAQAAPSPDPGPEPPPAPLSHQAPHALPPASPDPSPDLAAPLIPPPAPTPLLPPTPPAFSQSTDAPAPGSPSAQAAPSPDPGPEPPPAPLSRQAPDALPPASPDPSPDLAAPRPALLIAPSAPTPLLLPRQRWESVQQVHRTINEWFAGMRTREAFFATLPYSAWRAVLLAGSLPSLPVLQALPTLGP